MEVPCCFNIEVIVRRGIKEGGEEYNYR